jgi:hypothetical protein
MSESKAVGRKVIIVLGAVCIMLAVGMVVALFSYLPAADQINALNTQIAEKNQNIATLTAQITSLTAQINSQSGQTSTSNQTYLQNQIDALQGRIEDLNNVLYLNVSSLLVPNQGFMMDANSNITIWEQTDTPLIYAGLVTVQVTASTSSTTFVELSYDSLGVAYDRVINVGNSGTAAFPVLPGAVTISLGNTETNGTITGNIIATYVY